MLPINWIGAALLILGVSLFVLEAKFASHGILGGGGTVAMVLGALLLINGPPEVRIHLSTALAVTHSVRADHDVPGVAGGARAANKAVMGRGIGRRDRRGSNGARAIGDGVFAGMNIGTRSRRMPSGEGGASARAYSVEGLKLHVFAGARSEDACHGSD